MKKLVLTMMLLAALGMSARAAASDDDLPPSTPWELSLHGALGNRDNWEVEIGGAYRPVKFRYVGLGLSMILTGLTGGGQDNYIYYMGGKPVWSAEGLTRSLAFRGELQLTTPSLRVGGCELALRVSPGVVLALPNNNRVDVSPLPDAPGVWQVDVDHVKNHGGRCAYASVRALAVLNFDEHWDLMAGYGWSNFDWYGGARNAQVNGVQVQVPGKKPVSNVTIGVSYKF